MSEPKLVKSKRGVYEIRWSAWDDKKNRLMSKSLSTRQSSWAEASTVFAAFLSTLNRAEQELTSPQINELIALYKSSLESDESTQNICLKHLERELGSERVVDITEECIQTYRRARGVKDGTLRRELGVLVAVFNHAVKMKRIKRDDINYFTMPAQSPSRHVFLNPEQEPLFHAAALAHTQEGARLTRLSRFVAIALNTGARREAILDLKWEHIDPVSNTIDFRLSQDTLSNKRRSLVPISKRLKPLIARMYDERISLDPKHPETLSEYVLDHNGAIKSQWERWIAKTPWAHIHIHDLRRTFATLLVMKGVPIPTVAGLIGDNPITMLKTYSVYVPAAGQAAIDLVG